MQKITINPELSTRTIGADLFIFDRKNNLIHSFNETGAFLWELLKTGKTGIEMIDALLEEFDVDRASAENDVAEFTALVFERKLVTTEC